jgi:hypothetical protein
MTMLTREELHAECRKIFDALPDHKNLDIVDDAVLKLNKQAALAIDLQSTCNNLQSRIDKAIEFCNRKAHQDRFGNEYTENCVVDGEEYMADEILSTLDEKG